MKIALANFTRRAGTLLASATFVFMTVFVFSSGAAAASVQKKAATSAAVAAKTAAPVQAKTVAARPAESAAKGMNTGITVHGHWVINVLTPGGKLVSHTEFENNLQGGGIDALAGLLGQNATVGPWGITLVGSTGPCAATNGCTIVQAGSGVAANCTGPTCSPSLTVDGGTITQQSDTLLSGTFTFPSSPLGGGNITAVATDMRICTSGSSSASCVAGNVSIAALVSQIFSSSTNFPGAPVNVGAGQIVQVTVKFSFS